MRILLVSEGRHEINLSHEDPAQSPLVYLIMRLMGRVAGEDQFVRKRVSDPEVTVFFARGKAEAYEKRTVAWLKYGAQHGFDAVVLVVDQDRKPEDRAGLVAAQSSTVISTPRAIGVAIESFDAWILADEKAVGSVVNQRVRIKTPEALHGRDSKGRCKEYAMKIKVNPSEFYLAVLTIADLDTLERRCPKGFKPFADSVRLIPAR